MKVPHGRSGDSMEVKMTPMIDVVFLLLVFFIWTSSFEVPEFDLPSALAVPPPGGTDANTTETRPAEIFDEIFIRLYLQDARLVIQFNGQEIPDIANLTSRLREILSLGVQPPVIIDPADQVTMDHAVAAYDAARLAGADRVLFAARAPETTSP